MKKMVLGAALCGAAVALASPANADSNSDFWASAANSITDWLLGPSGTTAAASSSLAGIHNDFLDDSTQALILGATGMPTPTDSYLSDAANLYLFPNGYDGDATSILGLTTPQTFSFFPSVQEGQGILINAITEKFQDGDMGCNLAGICTDPLTIFTYSQSSAIAALVQDDLARDDIPSDALRFIMVGANPLGVADDLYPTEIYNIANDVWAQPFSLGSNWNDILLGFLVHEAYLGLTEEQLASASTVVDGLTTIHTIPALTFPDVIDAFINIWFGD